MVEQLQVIESNLSFSTAGALRRLRLDEVQEERIPADEEERKQAVIPKYSRKWGVDDEPVSVDGPFLAGVVAAGQENKPLVDTKAFFREGMNEYRSHKYIQAYYNFFFVLEDYFAPGKSGQKAVIVAFTSNEFLRIIVGRAFNDLRNDKRHWPKLKALYEAELCSETIEGTITLL